MEPLVCEQRSHMATPFLEMLWTVHLEGGPRRVNHAAVCVEDKIYCFGGFCSTEEYRDWDPIPVHVLNTATLRWSPLYYNKCDMLPFQRYGHTVVASGHKIFMWGGRNNSVACDALCCFDTRTLNWTSPEVTGNLPFARDGHSACVIKNRMYIFGGFEYFTNQFSCDVHFLDLETMIWHFVPSYGILPNARDFHTAVPVEDKMFVFGGRGESTVHEGEQELYGSEVFCFDTINQTWTFIKSSGQKPEGRRSHSAWFYQDFMYIFGGYNGNAKCHYNNLYRFSLNSCQWQKLDVPGHIPTERRRQVCVRHRDKVFLFGGTSPCDNGTIDDGSDDQLTDNDDLHVLDYQPTLKTLAILAVIKYNLNQSFLPREIISQIRIMTIPNRINRPISQNG